MADPARLLCDAMLGGLARWLRAMGHAASFEPVIADDALVRRAQVTGEIVLSSDAPLFERRAFTSGTVRGLFVPRHAPVDDQLVFVMKELGLGVLPPRCMACGGGLLDADPELVEARVPARSREAFERFFACDGCGRLFGHGTHWARIAKKRERIAAAVAAGR